MPKGVYVRQQEEIGYKDKAYWARRLKEQADFVCELCSRQQPARLLRAESDSGKLTLQDRVICTECLAARHFNGPVLGTSALLKLARDSGAPVSKSMLRYWTKVGLLTETYLGYLPKSLLPKVALLYYNRSLPCSKLKDLLSRQQVRTLTLQNLITGLPEVLTVIEEFSGIAMDGRIYHCQRLLNGDLFIKSERRGTRHEVEKEGVSHGMVQA